MFDPTHVSIVRTNCFHYPDSRENFRPSILYPEYTGRDIAQKENKVYDAVRESLKFLRLDLEHYGTPVWNPLGEFIQPGMSVLIKPNLVMHENLNPSGGTDCLYTHPSVVAPVVDYILLALKGTGKIVIGDTPVQSCDFNTLIESSGYSALVTYYQKQGINISIVDFRSVFYKTIHDRHTQKDNVISSETIINLGTESEFYALNPAKFSKMRVTSYDPRILSAHHYRDKHEYSLSKYVLASDVIINMPKPKTHRKAGVTISLKNFIGTNTHKEFLPHHTMGAVCDGGDEYEHRNLIQTLRSLLYDQINIQRTEKRNFHIKLYSFLIRCLSDLLRLGNVKYSEGSWYGNHTISRTIVDINKLIYYTDKNGILQDYPMRKIIIIADMIISGEKEGPLKPSPKSTGIIASGINPVCFDEAIATLMGMDITKIPTLHTARRIKGKYQLVNDLQVPHIFSNDPALNEKQITEISGSNLLHFVPSDGWNGHIEKS